MSHDVLGDACETVLAHVLTALDDQGLAPNRSYVSPADPPADCFLVATYGAPRVKQVVTGVPVRQQCSILHEAEISVRYWNCIPQGTPPDLDALHDAGLLFHQTLWVVWKRLAELITTASLLDGVTCQNASLLDARLEAEEGGYGGWVITVRADLGPLISAAVS